MPPMIWVVVQLICLLLGVGQPHLVDHGRYPDPNILYWSLSAPRAEIEVTRQNANQDGMTHLTFYIEFPTH